MRYPLPVLAVAGVPVLHEALSLVDETSGETLNFGLELAEDLLTVALTPALALIDGHLPSGRPARRRAGSFTIGARSRTTPRTSPSP